MAKGQRLAGFKSPEAAVPEQSWKGPSWSSSPQLATLNPKGLALGDRPRSALRASRGSAQAPMRGCGTGMRACLA